MRRRLLRPAVLLPAFAILSLGAGIAYAAWTQFDAGRIDANEALLDSVPAYPGSREIERITRTATGDGLPVPDEVLTSALYAPPPDASQADIVDFFVGSLTPEWESSTRTVTASGEDVDPDAALPSSFRVLFSRGDDCLQLLTYGMAPGHIGERTFALSVESGQGPCEVD
ncbi:MAG: hypothetical protein ACRDM2_07215 [Gaiellaceae bacterium]